MGSERTERPAFDWRAMTPDDSPLTPPDLAASEVHRDLSTPDVCVGDEAFDFALEVFDFSDGTKRSTGRTMRLSEEAAHRPVVLIFGSYT